VSRTLTWGVQEGRELHIAEADIVFNPRRLFATNGRADAYDIQQQLMLLLSMAVGLDPAPIVVDAMLPFRHRRQTTPRGLWDDDIAGVRSVYGLPADPEDGAISGQVLTESGAPVFGAHVTALDAAGIVRVGAITEPNGRFTIPSPPAGPYHLYAEPLNGPLTASQLSPGYGAIRRAFRVGFAGGSATPATADAVAGQTTAVDPIEVVARTPTLSAGFLSWS
jgi:carboxypeptidase family protein